MIKKSIFELILFLVTISLSGQTSKLDMICHHWIQFGYKSNSDSAIKTIKADCSQKKCEFMKNGDYQEEMFCVEGSGNWAFNSDSTKFGYQFTEYMGHKIGTKNPVAYYNQIILKLTPDTLIYGSEGYYGKEKKYGHDDWYFVRVK